MMIIIMMIEPKCFYKKNEELLIDIQCIYIFGSEKIFDNNENNQDKIDVNKNGL